MARARCSPRAVLHGAGLCPGQPQNDIAVARPWAASGGQAIERLVVDAPKLDRMALAALGLDSDFQDPLIVQMILALAEIEDKPSDQLLAEALSTAIVRRIRQRFEKGTDLNSGYVRALSHRQMLRVLTLAALADVARLSASHFRRAMGMTVHSHQEAHRAG